MKKIFLLCAMFGLLGCDKAEQNVDLQCDLAGTSYLINANIYEDRADLEIKVWDKDLRNKERLRNHTWLENQIPQIDDVLVVSLPKNDKGDFEESGHIKLELNSFQVPSGYTNFVLWFATDNNLVMPGGGIINNGEYITGADCRVLTPINSDKKQNMPNISVEELKKIKNCNAYIGSLSRSETVASRYAEWRVYDPDTGRETFMDDSQLKVALGENELHYYFNSNLRHYADKVLDSCDVAEKLKQIIRQELDSVRYTANLECVDTGKVFVYGVEQVGAVDIYDKYAIIKNVSFGKNSVVLSEDGYDSLMKLFKVDEVVNGDSKFIMFENVVENIQLNVLIDVPTNTIKELSWSDKAKLSPDGLRIWNMCQ